MKLIYRGAEANLYEDKGRIQKIRVPKSYRVNQIDSTLRTRRTRQEAKIFDKLNAEKLPVPKILNIDEQKSSLEFEKIKGKQLKDVIDAKNYTSYGKQIGKFIATIHALDIIHGDLTTSNMIVKNKKIYFIDFGLGFFSKRVEDKAVDLHLLKEALDSKHYKIADKCFKTVLQVYKKAYKNATEVLDRLKKVEQRGRYKQRY